MSRTPDLAVTNERLRADQRQMRREFAAFCNQVDEMEEQLGATHRESLALRELVRWLLKDTNVPDLTVELRVGSQVDLDMAARLVDVMRSRGSSPDQFAAEEAEWEPLTTRFRRSLADEDQVGKATDPIADARDIRPPR